VARLVNAWGIDENDLPGIAAVNALDAMTCGLRFVRDRRDLLADDAVKKRGFSGVRPAN
jgi:hypothetical protein